MSRILKRPMFRKGGSTNEGIMHGLVDRKGYSEGTYKERALEALREERKAKGIGGRVPLKQKVITRGAF